MTEKHENIIPKKNDLIEVVIHDLGNEGEGIGKYKGFTLFIKDVVVGDKLLARVMKVKKNYGYAKLEQLIEPSKDRVTARCPLAVRCGGCQLQQLSYEKQLEFKENKVRNHLIRIGGFSDVFMEPIIGMEEPFYYRNKAQFPVGLDQENRPILGFYAGHSHTIIDTTHCYIQDKMNVPILETIRDFLVTYRVSIYQEAQHCGLVRHVLTRIGYVTKEIMVCIVINGTTLPHAKDLVMLLKEKLNEYKDYKLKSICLNVNTAKTNVILGDQLLSVYGDLYITDYIGSICYQISPLSFYQVNPVQTKKLYDLALEYAGLTGEEIVWDLYCGIGTISLFLAQHAKQVYGVEIVPQAIADAKQNAKRNGVKNTEFFVGAAETILPEQYRQNGQRMHADVIVVDPPRKGCEESLLETIVAMQPKRVVYISCDSATLARDLKYLTKRGYAFNRLRAVDQFAQGVHVESVCLLMRET